MQSFRRTIFAPKFIEIPRRFCPIMLYPQEIHDLAIRVLVRNEGTAAWPLNRQQISRLGRFRGQATLSSNRLADAGKCNYTRLG